jgi:hypothetical protein
VITSKNVKCKHCETEFPLNTKYDTEGYSLTVGWSALRDHWDREHVQEARALEAWLADGSRHQLPYESVEEDWERSQAACGTEVAA